MNTTQSPSRLRLIKLLIPPSNDPLLTPYQNQINPKILPLKKSFSILSNIRESSKIKQQKLQLSKNDFDKINRSYQSLKKLKKTYTKQSENEQGKQSDPHYINLVQLRKSILIRKKAEDKLRLFHSKTTSQLEEKQRSFSRLTEPTDRSKYEYYKSTQIVNKQKSRYSVEQNATKNLLEAKNISLADKLSTKPPKNFYRR